MTREQPEEWMRWTFDGETLRLRLDSRAELGA
jgi:hypothetical protein